MYIEPPDDSSVTDEDIELLKSVSLILRLFSLTRDGIEINENDKGRIIICHSIARLVHLFLPQLRVADGDIVGIHFVDKEKELIALHTTTHSWLCTESGNIIDPYPMGQLCLNTALLIPHSITPYEKHGFNQYREMPDVARQRFDEKKSWDDARFFEQAIRGFITPEQIEQEARIFDFM